MTLNSSTFNFNRIFDKEITKKILRTEYIPVPYGISLNSAEELDDVKIGFPLAIKPKDGNHGRGVTTNINTKEKAIQALMLAQKISKNIMIEKSMKGFDPKQT